LYINEQISVLLFMSSSFELLFEFLKEKRQAGQFSIFSYFDQYYHDYNRAEVTF